ncbi:uncharacterized protein LOC119719834 [Patiria miniata]|uniref:Myb/SANT-like DNA-binding domain-containing protein n=1 Tax=Patiria miniata TaxID=46514 RepID=A0A913Z0B0_PATMI|nr:uncharacterized protein LOC119719834 [Patiria miniata]
MDLIVVNEGKLTTSRMEHDLDVNEEKLKEILPKENETPALVDHVYGPGLATTTHKPCKRFLRKPEDQFKWSDEQTRKFLELRRKHIDSFFSGKRGSIQDTYAVILEEMGLTGQVTPSKARKKWNNMAQLYRRLVNQPTIDAGDGKKLVPSISWPFFRDVERTLELEPQGVQEEESERYEGTILEELSDHINAQLLKVSAPPQKKSKKTKMRKAAVLEMIAELHQLNKSQEEILTAKNELTLKILTQLV